MADLIMNIAKGKVGYYGTLPETNDALKILPLETSGLEADGTIADHDTVAAVVAANTEQSTIGRKTLSGVALTVDDSGDGVQLDCDDVTYTAPTGNAISSWLVFYVPDTTSEADSTSIPLLKLDRAVTPDGNDFTLSAASGLYTA